ncbi:MAG: ATP-binding protein [Xenococcaceae cyanobacterium MO_188.B19]|nr:ATP-binding protein [Xenococcaceae cyanobacterium MO_188.B19]
MTKFQMDLAKLERESIHTTNQIQPHGVLLVLQEPDLEILQVSENIKFVLAIAPEVAIGKTLGEILDPFQVERLKTGLSSENFDFINPSKVWVRTGGDDFVVFDAVFHRNADNLLILELEPAVSQENIPFLSFYHLARASINQLENTQNLKEFCNIIVKEVRKVTGFDRVMLYRFDQDDHGEVIAEEKREDLEPYLGLHYPESDIPRPARKLLSSNWIRLIPDAKAVAVEMYPPVQPESNHNVDKGVITQPLDLTHSILRSASPCHLEYLHNMGVGSSLTISLIKEGKLWGLIACHHQSAKYVPYELRKACEFLGRVVFSEISTREETEDYDYKMRLAYIQSQLIDYMSKAENFVEGLISHDPNLLDLTNAQGAAICNNGDWTLIGKTPSEEDLNYLVQWLYRNVNEEIFATDSLANHYSDADKYKDVASGLLAIPISQRNYLLWFRPEVIQTVNWGGDPNKAYETNNSQGTLRLSPRKSFDLWKEKVRLTSLPWKQVEIQFALELRKAIVNIILKQADELAQLARDLERSNGELKRFAYVASHDLQEPLNHVSNYVQLLEMRYGDKLDLSAKEFIGFAVAGVSLMQNLIDDVLAYSKVDLQGADFTLTDTNISLEKALNNLQGSIRNSQAEITCHNLPTVMADSSQLVHIFQNLIGNAIKFRSQRSLKIEIDAERLDDSWLFSVRDNGIGLDPQFSDRIFVIFQRLHTRDEYPGTGMGLAICKKIVECHRGNIWVESELDKGATFYFTIPVGGAKGGRRDRRKV